MRRGGLARSLSAGVLRKSPRRNRAIFNPCHSSQIVDSDMIGPATLSARRWKATNSPRVISLRNTNCDPRKMIRITGAFPSIWPTKLLMMSSLATRNDAVRLALSVS